MSKLLVVFGVSGNQGGSVASFVIEDPELSREYKVRAVTRDPSKPAMKDLGRKGIEIVKGDLDDEESVKHALQGVHSVFLMTVSARGRADGKQYEIAQGKRVADLAVAAGAEYIIFSSIPSPATISKGKLTKVDFFEAKYELEQYMRTLPIGSIFFAPAQFMQNVQTVYKLKPAGDGSYVLTNILNPETEVPEIDVANDTGKWIGAILADPNKYNHKIFCAGTRLYSMQEMVDVLSKATGKKVVYKQVPDEVYKGFLPPAMQEPGLQMLQYIRDYGYYGPDQKELVEWAAKQARGKLTTLEEYLTKNPVKLD